MQVAVAVAVAVAAAQAAAATIIVGRTATVVTTIRSSCRSRAHWHYLESECWRSAQPADSDVASNKLLFCFAFCMFDIGPLLAARVKLLCASLRRAILASRILN
jgi:hypothetical protein